MKEVQPASKQTIRLMILLVVLIAVTVVVFFLQQDRPRVVVDPLLFRPADVATLDHVVLETPKEKIDLKYDGRTWKLNSSFDADDQLIKVLMATLLQVTPKRPVAAHEKDSVGAQLRLKGTKVSLYTAQGLERQFIAGGNSEKTEAYFKDEKGGDVFVMTIPGYRVYASGIFELNENQWRDKRIFNFNWRNFRQLDLTWVAEPGSSFEFVKQKEFLGIVGLEDPDSTRINNFLNDVLTLTADQIVPAGSLRALDSLVKTNPLIRIEVKDIAKRVYSLELFPLMKSEAKIVGKAWTGEIVLFDRRKLFAVMKKRGYFQSKQPTGI